MNRLLARSSITLATLTLALALAACGSKPAAQPPGGDPVGGDPVGGDPVGGDPAPSAVRTIAATLIGLQMGDLACYVDYDDGSDVEGNLPGTFDMCDFESLIGQQVVLTVEPLDMADCESIEPCGKTVRTDVVTKIDAAP